MCTFYLVFRHLVLNENKQGWCKLVPCPFALFPDKQGFATAIFKQRLFIKNKNRFS
jgi:hypothetical protein